MLMRVFSPTETLLEKEVEKVTFQALDGAHTFLPKHADYFSILTPDVVVYESGGQKSYIACNQGVILKQGEAVFLSVRSALFNNDLKSLVQQMRVEFKKQEEERKETNAVMARLEAGLTRGFMKLSDRGILPDDE
jgi:F-type H+-transporting ATPase subunit epsilon